MGWNAMKAVYEKELDCKHAEKNVLVAIAYHANDAGWCYPGIERLAKMTNMTDRGVSLIIQRMEDAGKLIVERNWGPKGTNRYCLTCVSGGRYEPPPFDAKLEPNTPALTSGVANPVHLPEPGSPPPKTLGNQSSPPNAVRSPEPASPRTPMAPASGESSGIRNSKKEGGEALPLIITLEEVLAHAAAYPGNPERGIPTVIPQVWARNHFEYRSASVEGWSTTWRPAMWTLYEKLYQKNAATPVGAPTLSAVPAAGGSRVKKSDGTWALKQRLEALKNLKARHAANELSVSYSGQPTAEEEADYEKLLGEIRLAENQLAGRATGNGVPGPERGDDRPTQRPKWQIEKDLASVEKQMDEHPVQWLAANDPLSPEDQASWEKLKSKHLKLKKELEACDD